MRNIHTPWIVGRTLTTHSHPTKGWITYIDNAKGDLVAEVFGSTEKEAHTLATIMAQSVNVGVGLAALVDARLEVSS